MCHRLLPQKEEWTFLGKYNTFDCLLDCTGLTRVNSSEKWLMPIRMYSENASRSVFHPNAKSAELHVHLGK